MPRTRLLPPQFLLPAWSPQQLARVYRTQIRLNHDFNASSEAPPIKVRRQIMRSGKYRPIRDEDEHRFTREGSEHPLPEQSATRSKPMPSEKPIRIARVLSKQFASREKLIPLDNPLAKWGTARLPHHRTKEHATNTKHLPDPSRTDPSPLPVSQPASESDLPRLTDPLLAHSTKFPVHPLPNELKTALKPVISEQSRVGREQSLFATLFPEEVEAEEREAEKRLERLPAFNWNVDKVIESTQEVAHNGQAGAKSKQRLKDGRQEKVAQPALERRTSVLVLSAASKTLEESDFFRLSPKGEHIEGWTSGITKVIPARDPRTLEPLGYYFILFTNEYAARAYLDNMIRLHKMARNTKLSDPFLGPAYKDLLQPCENLEDLLRGFTLVPTHSRLSLRLLGKPHTPHIANIVKYGGIEALAKGRNNAEDMVLLWTEAGQWSTYDIAEALKADGVKRNLFWKLAGSGQDIMKLSRDQVAPDESVGEEPLLRNHSVPSRYTIAFKDRDEARRFVREWNRRPFPLRRGQEDSPMMNVEKLW